jgi:hypothetical protein
VIRWKRVKKTTELSTVVQSYNPSTWESGGRRIMSLRPAQVLWQFMTNLDNLLRQFLKKPRAGLQLSSCLECARPLVRSQHWQKTMEFCHILYCLTFWYCKVKCSASPCGAACAAPSPMLEIEPLASSCWANTVPLSYTPTPTLTHTPVTSALNAPISIVLQTLNEYSLCF